MCEVWAAVGRAGDTVAGRSLPSPFGNSVLSAPLCVLKLPPPESDPPRLEKYPPLEYSIPKSPLSLRRVAPLQTQQNACVARKNHVLYSSHARVARKNFWAFLGHTQDRIQLLQPGCVCLVQARVLLERFILTKHAHHPPSALTACRGTWRCMMSRELSLHTCIVF